MRRDAIPDRNYLVDLDNIISAKRGPNRRRLDRLKPFLPAAYWDFVFARRALETVPRRRWTSAVKIALQHCYSRTETRNQILQDLQTAVTPVPYLCPYCLMRQPKSWDHFLPQDHSPEFSVLALNLVLICETCNRRKSNDLVDQPRAVLNPYFDELPSSPILHAHASLGARGVGLTFLIRVDDPASPGHLQALAERHVEAFGLFDEYEREGSSFVADVVTTIAAQYRGPITQETLDAALDARMRGLSDFPINSWRGAVISALEQLDGLLGHVNHKILTSPQPPRLRPRPDRIGLRRAAAAAAASTSA